MSQLKTSYSFPSHPALLHIITPVKGAIELTLDTAQAIMNSQLSIPYRYTIYDDFSTDLEAKQLDEAAAELGFEVVHLKDITQTQSPNYGLVLQIASQRALAADASLLIVESDVVVYPDTAQRLLTGTSTSSTPWGLAAAVTTDKEGIPNYPYVQAQKMSKEMHSTNHHLSFCCTLFSTHFLRLSNFETLDPSKDWYDVTISRQSLSLGLANYLFTNIPVWHRPHGSRPWKLLKYRNPLKYYLRKLWAKKDRI